MFTRGTHSAFGTPEIRMSTSTLLRAVFELWADPERRVVRVSHSAARLPGPGGEWKVSLWKRSPRVGQRVAPWCLRIVGPRASTGLLVIQGTCTCASRARGAAAPSSPAGTSRGPRLPSSA